MSNYEFLQGGVPQDSVSSLKLFCIRDNDIHTAKFMSIMQTTQTKNLYKICSTNIDSIQLELDNDIDQLDL